MASAPCRHAEGYALHGSSAGPCITCVDFLCFLRRPRQNHVDDDDDVEMIPRPLFHPGPHHPGYIPVRFWLIVDTLLRFYRGSIVPDLRNVDAFAGKAAISKAFLRQNMPSVALDLQLDERDVPCMRGLLKASIYPYVDHKIDQSYLCFRVRHALRIFLRHVAFSATLWLYFVFGLALCCPWGQCAPPLLPSIATWLLKDWFRAPVS